ncbi:MAG: DegT/DnrJ/EryC1/StrS family aminotransferase [Planctomycetes bacterium]|nr:DegT/DnrJ/EryC1/StrS family aminotransferase [Planctomycetota bacterium]
MQVPGIDLKGQLAPVRDELVAAVTAVIDSNQYCNGPAVRDLEKLFTDMCRCKAAVGVSNGTDALIVSLIALGVGPGDEVIVPPFTFFATAGAVWRVGARPVFADILPDTFNIDPAKVAAAVTPKTRAIMPVHLYGQVADMDELLAVAGRHKLSVIEDAAQAVGATYKGRPAGAFGTTGCFSFYPTKNLSAIGEAGLITTQDEALAARLAATRNHGMNRQYFHDWVGGNFRMDTIQAAALLVKARRLTDWTNRRRANAALYNRLLEGCKQIVRPVERQGNFHVYHQYVIRAQKRDQLQAFLKENGVASGIYYPLGLHLQDCFKPLGGKNGDFPVSEQATREVLALPIHPELTDPQIQHAAEKIVEFYKA